jgi:hypothetical protein
MPKGAITKLRRLIALYESAARQVQFVITNRHETTAVRVLHDESADALIARILMRQLAVVLSWLERGQALGGFFIQRDNLGFAWY